MVFNPFRNSAPTEIVRTAAERPEARIVVPEKPDLTHKQMLKKMVMTSVNKKHNNGRIYNVDKDGNYSSHSVSPYTKVFQQNLEDGIKDLVISLAHKGYLPISSCASHELWDRRFFALCFTSSHEAEKFMRLLARIKIRTKKLHHLIVKLFPAHKYLNTSVEINKKGTILDVQKTEIQTNQINEYLQTLFMRTSEDWWVVHVEIMPDLEPTWWNNTRRWWYKKFSLEADTKLLTEEITNAL